MTDAQRQATTDQPILPRKARTDSDPPDRPPYESGPKYLWLLGIALGAAYWIAEGAFDSFLFNRGSLADAIVAPGPDTLLMRLAVLVLTSAFGLYAQSSVSRLHRAHETIRHMALHDSLTGLPNRVLFYDRLGQAMAQARRNKSKPSVILLDLDDFKRVNDSLGHHFGDQLLARIGERLMAILRRSDTVARWGGDEFVVLLPDVNAAADALNVTNKITAAFKTPFVIDGREILVSPSVGAALYPDDGEDPDTLIKSADAAMYQAKGNFGTA